MESVPKFGDRAAQQNVPGMHRFGLFAGEFSTVKVTGLGLHLLTSKRTLFHSCIFIKWYMVHFLVLKMIF